jgi:hypothetical protein
MLCMLTSRWTHLHVCVRPLSVCIYFCIDGWIDGLMDVFLCVICMYASTYVYIAYIYIHMYAIYIYICIYICMLYIHT